MNLAALGYNDSLEEARTRLQLNDFEIGRVTVEHKERYIVRTQNGEYEAEITGNLRYTAKSREDFPAVGDWVALIVYDSDLAIIHAILPRFSSLSRQAVGKHSEKQIIGANIDYAFLVQAVDRDFNINRIERYLTLCYDSGIKPLIVLTKVDLITAERLAALISQIKQRIKQIQIFTISNETGTGIEDLKEVLEKGKTYCMLGSSGVGKSSLLNSLTGTNVMKTDHISTSTNKGRHVTSHRELTVLESGGIIIDNPGMREIGIADSSEGLEATFETIIRKSAGCKFKDCTHQHEKGCAVLKALEDGEIDNSSYENYLKLEREEQHFERTVMEKRKRDKAFGKMVKSMKNDMQKLSSKHKSDYKK